MSVTFDIEYKGDLICEAVHEPSKTILLTDAPLDNGGKASSFSPTDLVATGFGTCIMTIVGLVAQRKNIDIRGTRVHVVKEMTAVPVRRIASLVAKVVFPKALADVDKRLFEQAANACPVKQSLHPEVKMNIIFEYPST